MNKKTTFYTVITALIFSALGSSVFAMETSGGSQYQIGTETATRLQKNFCTNLTGFSALKNSRLAEWDKGLSSKRVERSTNIDNRRTSREQKLDEVRANADAKRANSYNKISAKAVTDEQKAAIQKFQDAVEVAVAERRTAINAAVSAYRDGLDQAIADRKSALDQALNTFKLVIKTAEDNASSQCSKGKEPLAVRTEFQAAVSQARSEYKDARTSAAKISESVAELNEIRKAAFEAAKEDFKAAFEAAKSELKAAFPLKGEQTANNSAE